jgi:hypothetical protein
MRAVPFLRCFSLGFSDFRLRLHDADRGDSPALREIWQSDEFNPVEEASCYIPLAFRRCVFSCSGVGLDAFDAAFRRPQYTCTRHGVVSFRVGSLPPVRVGSLPPVW